MTSKQTVYTLQSSIRETKITTSLKERISDSKGGRGGSGVRDGGGRVGGGGNHYQGKQPYKGGCV